jgi:hypothetical protein
VTLRDGRSAGLNVPCGIKSRIAAIGDRLAVKSLGFLSPPDRTALETELKAWLGLMYHKRPRPSASARKPKFSGRGRPRHYELRFSNSAHRERAAAKLPVQAHPGRDSHQRLDSD